MKNGFLTEKRRIELLQKKLDKKKMKSSVFSRFGEIKSKFEFQASLSIFRFSSSAKIHPYVMWLSQSDTGEEIRGHCVEK